MNPTKILGKILSENGEIFISSEGKKYPVKYDRLFDKFYAGKNAVAVWNEKEQKYVITAVNT